MKTSNYKCYVHKECEFYPCHTLEEGQFNCLFCYCPLYSLGEKCGGNFAYTEDGIKDCSGCTIPHGEGGHEHVMSKWPLLVELARKK